ncbi:gamma-DL-glutamyl hydrolase [Abditibacteriota bacterium]|nr:gamma-DL-glutamyl hydrolase [Abditibacteriota bacterium]
MFRPVLLVSFGVLAIQPVFAQEVAPAQMSSGSKPGSSIALSSFALAQRDEAREKQSVSHPTLQASVPAPTSPSLAVPLTSPIPQGTAVVTKTPLAPRAIGVGLTPLPTAIPVLTAPVPPPVNAAVPQISTKIPAIPTKTDDTTPKTVVLPKVVVFPGVPAVQPKTLASREAMRQRTLLSQLDADLAAAQPRLDRAQARLNQSQRQLGAFTTTLRSAMMEAGDEGSGLHPFVRVAQRYLGTPYVWGGESARGFDCSGFIMRVMRDLGYRALPHSAAEQFHYGTPIARELLKPGDVVFFANTYKPGVSHVGIYLGRGRFIHAANSRVGTIVSSLNEPKWVAHYAGARRLVRARA